MGCLDAAPINCRLMHKKSNQVEATPEAEIVASRFNFSLKPHPLRESCTRGCSKQAKTRGPMIRADAAFQNSARRSGQPLQPSAAAIPPVLQSRVNIQQQAQGTYRGDNTSSRRHGPIHTQVISVSRLLSGRWKNTAAKLKRGHAAPAGTGPRHSSEAERAQMIRSLHFGKQSTRVACVA